MKFITILGVLMLLMISSCVQQIPKSNEHIAITSNLKTGLYIENGINRGLAFIDTLGDKYAMTYISVTVKNDSTIPIRFQTHFDEEYEHPLKESDEKYKVVILPEEWTYDGIEISDSLIRSIPLYTKKRTLTQTLKPKEHYTFALGTLRPSPAKVCGVIPNYFFVQNADSNYHDCHNLQQQESSNGSLNFGLKLDYCHNEGNAPNCTIISCGQISYPKL